MWSVNKNVHLSQKELHPSTRNQSVVIVAAWLDNTSLFQGLASIAQTTTSTVTLMTTTNLILEMCSYDDINDFCKY